MSAAVVFILFVICLVIAIPVSISLGIVAVLPGAFDSSFTASASYVIRSMRTVRSPRSCLMCLFILLEKEPQESHVRLSSPACSMERFPALRLQLLRLSEV